MKRGIFLVANLQSQDMCANLVYSIRETGCTLPIRIIHFGGKKITSKYLRKNTELKCFNDFPNEAKEFIANLRSVLTECPLGFLYRFLALFSDWDEFIYSDNDIVALADWTLMFEYLSGNDIVHADGEYTTNGKFNYDTPQKVKEIFGSAALDSAMTAGHIAVKRSSKLIRDINSAAVWFKENPGIAKKHDQALLHIASLLGNWQMLNLCKPPYNWLSSWAGDYKNSLQLIQQILKNKTTINHLHYSGHTPNGSLAIEELLLSNSSSRKRLRKLLSISILALTRFFDIRSTYIRIKKGAQRRLRRGDK